MKRHEGRGGGVESKGPNRRRRPCGRRRRRRRRRGRRRRRRRRLPGAPAPAPTPAFDYSRFDKLNVSDWTTRPRSTRTNLLMRCSKKGVN